MVADVVAQMIAQIVAQIVAQMVYLDLAETTYLPSTLWSSRFIS
jgi:hypothetical protein